MKLLAIFYVSLTNARVSGRHNHEVIRFFFTIALPICVCPGCTAMKLLACVYNGLNMCAPGKNVKLLAFFTMASRLCACPGQNREAFSFCFTMALPMCRGQTVKLLALF